MGRRSDPAWREEAAWKLLAERVLPSLPPAHAGPLLLVDEVRGGDHFGGREVWRWNRRAGPGGRGTVLPTATGAAVAALRMPRSRAALALAVRAAAACLRPGGLLLVYGANDEGTGSIDAEMEAVGAE
ncbi:MAG: hypothetical protein RQ745_11695, partial [Longimicrobiales bacterium]|nr:hypothetical protein [Longimicrobiales bacterium]